MAIVQDITEHIQMEKQRKTFVASFSHELRTPLAGIMGMLELLSNLRLDPQALEYTHKAAVSANLLLNLVNDILDMSRIEAGKMSINAEIFDLHDAIKSSVELVRQQAEMKGAWMDDFNKRTTVC
jgi:signal transduction histidine kinase